MTEQKSILIIDDDDDLRMLSRLALQAADYQVAEATDGRKGLEALEDSKPDLIILDIMMPAMNGVEFCRRMLGNPQTKDIPVLVVSGVNQKAKIVREFIEMPLTRQAFMPKPIETDNLIAKVGELLGGKPAVKAAPQSVKTPPKPAAPPSSPRPRQADAKSAPGGSEKFRVLVVDDEDDIRMLLRTALGLEYIVETAENGMVALEAIDRFAPDFVICDINMPVMNGMETVEAIRQHPRFGQIPVFFLTGQTEKDLPKQAFDIGANLFLRKPLDPMRLLKLIDYFIKEAGLEPGQYAGIPMPQAPKAAKTAPRKPAKSKRPTAAPRPGQKVRVLTIDHEPEHIEQFRRMFKGPIKNCETLWADNVRTALGNLVRWEPDVILFNPRNSKMDGIAFGQVLKMKKLAKKYEIAFIGKKFYDADLKYSSKNFKRDVILTTRDDATITQALISIIGDARKKMGPKKHTIAEIERLDRKVREETQSKSKKELLQREAFREKFSRIQQFIDRER